MNTPGDIKNSAYGLNGPMTETFQYDINGTKIYETLDINLNSPTYGKTVSVKSKVNGKLEEVGPNGELGLAIVADQNSARQTSFLNEMQYIGGKAEKANRANSHEIALKNSGMWEVANGDRPYEAELPAVEYVIGTTEVENSSENDKGKNNQTDTGTDASGASKEEERVKSFVGLLQYPANAHYNDRSRPTQDHMKIDMFQYEAPQKHLANVFEGGVKPSGTKDGDVAKQRFNYTALSFAYPQTIPFTLGRNLFNKDNKAEGEGANDAEGNRLFSDTVTKGLGRGTNIKKYLGTVKMPIPNQLRTANGVSWGEGRANAFEAASFLGAFNTIRGAISGKKNIGDVFRDVAGTAKNLGIAFASGEAGDANTLLASAAARAALASININTDPNQFMTRATGKAINPNLELLFAGPKLRSFQFSFQFAPQNIEDAAVTRRIMRFFKQGMLPSRGMQSDLFLMSPNVFRLSFMNGQDKIRSLNSFKLCALTSCQIDFTPDGSYQAYDDPSVISQPVRSQMTLGFTELTPIFWDDYESDDGYRSSILDLQRNISEEGPRETGSTTVTSSDDIGY